MSPVPIVVLRRAATAASTSPSSLSMTSRAMPLRFSTIPLRRGLHATASVRATTTTTTTSSSSTSSSSSSSDSSSKSEHSKSSGEGSSGSGSTGGDGGNTKQSFFKSDTWTKTVGTIGAIANWTLPMAGITHMLSEKDPKTTIDPVMTSTLAIYSLFFMRWALAISPANYPLLVCHMSNEVVQLIQLGRWGTAQSRTEPAK